MSTSQCYTNILLLIGLLKLKKKKENTQSRCIIDMQMSAILSNENRFRPSTTTYDHFLLYDTAYNNYTKILTTNQLNSAQASFEYELSKRKTRKENEPCDQGVVIEDTF